MPFEHNIGLRLRNKQTNMKQRQQQQKMELWRPK